MKLLKILLITVGTLSLFACNAGDNTTTNGVTLTTSNNTCQHQMNVGATCSISVTYSAANGNAAVGSSLQINGLSGYTNNINNCYNVNTTPNTCNITITKSQASTGAQTGTIIPSGFPSYSTTFTVGTN